jgi:hypothetical protein
MVAPALHRTKRINRRLWAGCGWGSDPAALRRLVRPTHPTPRPTCRDPYCESPIRHLDHIIRRADGGPTILENGRGTCERGNYVREMPGWHITLIDCGFHSGPHTIHITTPTGHHYVRRAPDPP